MFFAASVGERIHGKEQAQTDAENSSEAIGPRAPSLLNRDTVSFGSSRPCIAIVAFAPSAVRELVSAGREPSH